MRYASHVADLVGAGPGTTPTGDDMIVGALAALHLAGKRAEAKQVRQTHIVVPLQNLAMVCPVHDNAVTGRLEQSPSFRRAR